MSGHCDHNNPTIAKEINQMMKMFERDLLILQDERDKLLAKISALQNEQAANVSNHRRLFDTPSPPLQRNTTTDKSTHNHRSPVRSSAQCSRIPRSRSYNSYCPICRDARSNSDAKVDDRHSGLAQRQDATAKHPNKQQRSADVQDDNGMSIVDPTAPLSTKDFEQMMVLRLELRDKKLENETLRSRVRELNDEYRLFERKLAEQQATLLRLNRDLTNSNAQRIDRDERCAQLEIENVQHLTEIARLESANASARRELEKLLIQHDVVCANNEKNTAKIRNYQQQLIDKEVEQTALRDAAGDTLFNRSSADTRMIQLDRVKQQLDLVRAEKDALEIQVRKQNEQLSAYEQQLHSMTCDRDMERKWRESLQAQVIEERKQLVAKDNKFVDFEQRLSELNAQLREMRTKNDELNDLLELERAKAYSIIGDRELVMADQNNQIHQLNDRFNELS